MRKVIDGKMYDTKTAKLIFEDDNGLHCNDFNYESKNLYVKKTGEYFVFNEYYFTDKCHFEPVSEGEARIWLAKYCDGDNYEKQFGKVEE